MPKVKSKKQVRYLLSKGSPLSEDQKAKLKDELHSGEVKIKKHASSRGKKFARS